MARTNIGPTSTKTKNWHRKTDIDSRNWHRFIIPVRQKLRFHYVMGRNFYFFNFQSVSCAIVANPAVSWHSPCVFWWTTSKYSKFNKCRITIFQPSGAFGPSSLPCCLKKKKIIFGGKKNLEYRNLIKKNIWLKIIIFGGIIHLANIAIYPNLFIF